MWRRPPHRPLQPTYERERKFIIRDASIVDGAPFTDIVQGYLWVTGGWSQRVRFSRFGGMESVRSDVLGTYTLKGPATENGREEYEWQIPLDTAVALLARTPNKIRKFRHHLVTEGEAYDVDVFLGRNRGLVVAELESRDPYSCAAPSFAVAEVTPDTRFQNDYLAYNPFTEWPAEEREKYEATRLGRAGETLGDM